MALPYSAHPLYTFRKVLIWIAVVGILLDIFSLTGGSPEVFAFCAFLLAVSAFFCAADLTCYALAKVQKPDEDPVWPTRKWMIWDFLLAVALFFGFVGAIQNTGNNFYYYNGPGVVGAYGALCAGISAVLHTYCFYTQLVARYKTAWLATLPQQPCLRCGYSEPQPPQVSNPSARAHNPSTELPPNNYPYAGPSAQPPGQCQHGLRTNILTPEDDRDSAMEEGLLIGSDLGTGYGSISTPTPDPEPILEQPEGIVVSSGSGKGKKKAVAGSGIGGKREGKKAMLDDQ